MIPAYRPNVWTAHHVLLFSALGNDSCSHAQCTFRFSLCGNVK